MGAHLNPRRTFPPETNAPLPGEALSAFERGGITRTTVDFSSSATRRDKHDEPKRGYSCSGFGCGELLVSADTLDLLFPRLVGFQGRIRSRMTSLSWLGRVGATPPQQFCRNGCLKKGQSIDDSSRDRV